MLSLKGIQNACARRSVLCPVHSLRRCSARAPSALSNQPSVDAFGRRANCTLGRRRFSSSRPRQDTPSAEAQSQCSQEIEEVVRDAKQRFRDTLPRGYLNEQEYALYERLYGPPLRETEPEDVGIPTHADMGDGAPRPDDEGTLLRQLVGGELEEVSHTIEKQVQAADVAQDSVEGTDAPGAGRVETAAGYVDTVARSRREHEALQKLAREFEAARKTRKPKEDEMATSEAEQMGDEEPPSWPPEDASPSSGEEKRQGGEHGRYHRYTLEGKFHGSPVEISLPREAFISPIRELLARTHIKHVKDAAETAFGGRGLPTSPSTPEQLKNGNMGGVGLPPDQRHMTEIEADAFLAGYLPPAYASIASVLREVRRRVGSDWIQSRLKQGPGGGGGGLRVLDAGAGGAGLVAWEQVARAEWDLLTESGQVSGPPPTGKKTVIAASDRLRHRLKNFLDDTTFLPRLPDYEHSGETHGEHLDAGDRPQTRKTFDLIMASHVFVKEKQDHHRQAILNKLWSLLNKDGGILIVLEKAHPRGFEAVAHVRDTVLRQFLLPQQVGGGPARVDDDGDPNPALDRVREEGHIVAPCPNHGTCPMYRAAGKSTGRKDYCHFSQRFVQPKFHAEVLGRHGSHQGEVEFSYVVFRRGVPGRHASTTDKDDNKTAMTPREATRHAFRGFEHADHPPDMHSLPRLILPPLKRKGHVTLDVCTPEGTIERWTVPKSLSRLAYHDARKSRWGDLWALGAKTRVLRSVRAGGGRDDGGTRAAEAAAAARGKKKPRRVALTMDEGRMSTRESGGAGPGRRPRGRAAREMDLMREVFEGEARVEAALDEELDEELRGRARGGSAGVCDG